MIGNSFTGSNINTMKSHNLQVVLLTLLHHPHISRVTLAQKTNLSNSTISNLITELIHQGIVSEQNQPEVETNGPNPVGRPRASIHLIPNARFAVGVHIGIGIFRVAVVNVLGEVIHSQIQQFEIEQDADTVLNRMIHTVEECIQASQIDRSKVLGIGVGASGLVDFPRGINILAPNLNWHNVPIRDKMMEALNSPVVVDNNVRSMAIGEKYFGAGKDVDSLVFIYGRIGLGAGLIFKGEVFRGSTTGAGEIGHTVIQLDGGLPCRCGNTGCLETLVSEPAILSQAELIMRDHPRGILAKIQQSQSNLTALERVFTAARHGDQAVLSLLEERAHYLGVAVAGLVNLFNPQMILFGGIFAQGKDLLLEPIIQTVRHNAFGGLGNSVHMQAASFGWRAGVIGAAALALMSFFYQQSDSTNGYII